MAQRQPVSLGSWLMGAVAVALLGRWLFALHPAVGAAFLALIAAGVALALHQSYLRRRRGYWIEVLSPNRLRGEPDVFGVVYREGEREIWFMGRELSARCKWPLEIPSAAAWEASIGDWATGRRTEILRRVQEHSFVARRCEMVEASAG